MKNSSKAIFKGNGHQEQIASSRMFGLEKVTCRFRGPYCTRDALDPASPIGGRPLKMLKMGAG